MNKLFYVCDIHMEISQKWQRRGPVKTTAVSASNPVSTSNASSLNGTRPNYP
jgi:hypothetical protein